MTESSQANARRPAYRSSLRSRLTLGILGVFLTCLGLVVSSGGLPDVNLLPRSEGITDAHGRIMAEIKKLGGEAQVIERNAVSWAGSVPPTGSRSAFGGKTFDDEALARFIQTYGDRIWGLYLANTGVTDTGFAHWRACRTSRPSRSATSTRGRDRQTSTTRPTPLPIPASFT